MTSPNIISIAKPISLKTTKIINGIWSADIQIRADAYIASESYIDIDSEEYVVKSLKKIKSQGKYYYDVKLYHNAIEELTALTIDRFSYLKTVTQLLTLILAGTGWTAGTTDIGETISLVTDRRTTVLEALNLLAERCGGELYFYSKTRIVDLKREIGTNTGLQLRYDKNCDYIEKEEDSSNLVTRIYPSGPDNYILNTTVLDDCEDELLYTMSGSATKAASALKRNLTQGIQFTYTALNETAIRNLGAGSVVDLTGHDSLKFWIYSATANASGVTFGIGEAAYTEITVNSGALTAGCWAEISLDLSGVAAGDKDAIRYIGFKNLTSGAAVVVVDTVRAFSGLAYIDSANIALYKVRKEYAYFHSAKPVKTVYETILYPTIDTYVYKPNPTTNYNSSTLIEINNDGTLTSYTYMKFDIPVGITEAYLYLNSHYGYGATGTIYQNSADFTGTTITWNNMPATGASHGTIPTLAGENVSTDLITLIAVWNTTNYGLVIKSDGLLAHFYSNDYSNFRPYLKVIGSTTTNPSPVIEAAARTYLAEHEEPILRYKVKVSDLSKAMANTWEDETINIGDTLKLYDADLGLNVAVRVKKIVKDLLNPDNITIELENKAANIADLDAKKAKQLSYAMPYEDNSSILDANAVQVGYFGSNVNV